jgi:uncharacterized protein YrrD
MGSERRTTREHPTARRFEIRTGVPVVAGDDEIGQVDRVVVQPGSGEVAGIVVRKGLILRRDVFIPIEAVEDADEDVVRVRLSREEIDRLPELRDGELLAPSADWRPPDGRATDGVLFRVPRADETRGLVPARGGQAGSALGGRPVRAGMRVVCSDGDAGRLDLVLLEPRTRRATAFVVRRGAILGRDTIVPLDWVRQIDADAVVLDVPRSALNALPEYRPDDEIYSDVLQALWDAEELKPAELAFVEVQVRDGIVELRGHTLTDQSRRRIEEIVRGVPGVLGVRDEVQTIEELVAASTEEGRRSSRQGGREAGPERREQARRAAHPAAADRAPHGG